MKRFVLGTAGHIDHGKTSLVKALTGIDTDRLKEEKQRGITIELGFASYKLTKDIFIGIVDVPGHEKFVKNMVAGATGIDLVAMIIAADEGVMPQTKEHMEICSLLNIKHGLIVITKIDMVDEQWIELIYDDIETFTKDTFLENCPIVKVSSTKGIGIDDLINELKKICTKIEPYEGSDIFRLPVDRVFIKKGFGTVITGTLISGKINTGDQVMIYPSQIISKVRGIQFHNNSITQAKTSMRTAINFQGLENSEIKRGNIVSNVNSLKKSFIIDTLLTYSKTNEKALKNRQRIRFHTGTAEIIGIIILLNCNEMLPGQKDFVQIRLEKEVCLIKEDRFVIRHYSPVYTIGGGEVLNPIPVKHKRFNEKVINHLKILAENKYEEIITYCIKLTNFKGMSLSDIKIMSNLKEKKIQNILNNLLSKNQIILLDKQNFLYIHKDTLLTLNKKIIEIILIFHKQNPLKKGISKQEIKSKLCDDISSKLFNISLKKLTNNNEIKIEDDIVSHFHFKISLKGNESDIQKKIIQLISYAKLSPPYLKDIASNLNIDLKKLKDMLLFLTNSGKLIKVNDELFFDKNNIYDLQNKIIDFCKKNNELKMSDFKKISGISRKYSIPILEYFDKQKITIRVGDIRKLRKVSK